MSLCAGFEPRRGCGIYRKSLRNPGRKKGESWAWPRPRRGSKPARISHEATMSSARRVFRPTDLGPSGPFAVWFPLVRRPANGIAATTLQEIEIGAEVGLHDVIVIKAGITTCWRFCWLPGVAPAL